MQRGTILAIWAVAGLITAWLSSNLALAASKPAAYVICSNKTTGVVVVRVKCKASETRLTVLSALVGATGPQGATGADGPAGANGSASAWGFIKSDGTVDENRSSGLSSRKVGVGYYCLQPYGIAQVQSILPVISADFMDGNGQDHTAQLDSTHSWCNDDEWGVRTLDGGVSTDVAFSVIVP